MTLTHTARQPSLSWAPLHTIGHATARGFGTGLAMIRILRIARLARRDDDAGSREL